MQTAVAIELSASGYAIFVVSVLANWDLGCLSAIIPRPTVRKTVPFRQLPKIFTLSLSSTCTVKEKLQLAQNPLGAIFEISHSLCTKWQTRHCLKTVVWAVFLRMIITSSRTQKDRQEEWASRGRDLFVL